MAVELKATYQVTTPLFSWGADTKKPEFRLSAFKGALRFWWRALAWGRLNGDIEAIHQGEARIFGSASGGQSRLLLRLESLDPKKPQVMAVGSILQTKNKRTVGHGARYFGYGVMKGFGSQNRNTQSDQLTHRCLMPFSFTVGLRFKRLQAHPPLSAEEKESVIAALKAVGLFGGLGSKSRKGYGSLVLKRLEAGGRDVYRNPTSLSALQETISGLYAQNPGKSWPDYTALSKQARHILLLDSSSEALTLLNKVGCEMVRYRSWGRKGKILGDREKSEKKFEADHDLMRITIPKGEPVTFHPERIAFGLPHNYGKGTKNEVNAAAKDIERRGSPLFIHIHEVKGASVAILSFLPAQFLPSPNASTGRPMIRVGGTPIPLAPNNQLYQPIHTYLNRLLEDKRSQFSQAIEVKP